MFIAPIVEGHGEVRAVPVLLRRIASLCGPVVFPYVNEPIRVKSGSFLHDAEYFNRYVALAAAKAAQANGWVLILLDCEDDCPATVGPDLLARAQAVRSDVSYLVVMAYREFESWFIAAAESLRGVRGIPQNQTAPHPDEQVGIRDAKGWLSRRMAENYDPVIHQAEFTRVFDLEKARTNASFDRFFQRTCSMFAAIA